MVARPVLAAIDYNAAALQPMVVEADILAIAATAEI